MRNYNNKCHLKLQKLFIILYNNDNGDGIIMYCTIMMVINGNNK